MLKIRSRPTLSVLATLALSGLAAPAAHAALETFTYTIPQGGVAIDPMAQPYANPFNALQQYFPTVPFAAVTQIATTDLIVETTGTIQLGHLYFGTPTTFVDPTFGTPLAINGLSGDYLFRSNLNVGTSDPLTRSWNITSDFVQGHGRAGLSVFDIQAQPATTGTIRLVSGSLSLTVDTDRILDIPSPQPAPANATPIDLNSSASAPLTESTVEWFKFTYAGGPLHIDTVGSTLTDSDTHIALYDATGALIAEDDDVNPFKSQYWSQLDFAAGMLSPGDYYLGVMGFGGDQNAVANGFNLSSASGYTGTVVVNLNGGGIAPLPGDYNGDGTVDSADYTVWADHFGQSAPPGTPLPGDGNSDGIVDSADYTVWADHFGSTSAPLTSSNLSIPEPSGLLALALPALLLRRRR